MLEEMTKEEKAVVKAVTGQLINMLTNNVLYDGGAEGFEGWCEDGDVFELHNDYWDKCIELMHEVAPLIDELTYKYLNLGY